MTNEHAFELIHAGPGLVGPRLVVAVAIAQWLPWLVLLLVVAARCRQDVGARRELAQLLLAMLLALVAAEFAVLLWPLPRPVGVVIDHPYLVAAPAGACTPIVALWAFGLAALATRRHAVLGFPLLALGLVVGWCRVFLGANFPLEVLAALPAAALGTALAWLLRARIRHAYDRVERAVRTACGSRGRG